MVVLNAYAALDMGPTSSDYLPGETLVSIAPNQADALDSLNRLQRYFGVFNLIDVAQDNYATSTVTGYQQYAGSDSSSALLYEFSGASVNGQVAYDLIYSGKYYEVVLDIFKNADQLTGSGENDILDAFAGADTIRGRVGSDSLSGGDGADFLNGNEGFDTVQGGNGDDTLRGGKNGDVLRGGAGNDQLFGDLGDDELVGGQDNDRITGNAGNDTSTGGLGADVFVLSKDSDVIVDFSAVEGDIIEILTSTAYSLGSTGPDGSGDLQIIRDVGTTTLLGVSLAGFNEEVSIVLI
jgi:Ca2+-binding RTX toxin-like protein